MSESGERLSLHSLDRPLRRLAWVLPASLCLWVLILAGFALMLRNPSPPAVPPLEVDLVELGSGTAGGSPGGGPGVRGSGGAPGLKAVAPSFPPPRLGAPRRVSSVSKHSFAAAPQRRGARNVQNPRHRRLRDVNPSDDAAVRPVRAVSEEQADAEEAAPPPRPDHEPVLAPASLAPSPAKPIPQARDAMASPGGSGAGSGSGGGTGAAGAGTTGAGSGGEGGGTGAGIGEGSQPYASVAHPPVPISRVLPEYPGNARSQGVEGEVVLRAIVDRQGTVRREIVVVQSVPMLDRAAIEALRQWRFEPGRDAGNRAVPVVIEVPLRFRLR